MEWNEKGREADVFKYSQLEKKNGRRLSDKFKVVRLSAKGAIDSSSIIRMPECEPHLK